AEPMVGEVSPRAMLRALIARLPQTAAEPRDADALRVELIGRQGGRRVRRRAESVVLPHSRWKIAAGTLDTGVPLAIVGAMLARREIVEPGVLCPESCLDFDRFFAELAKREIRVTWSE